MATNEQIASVRLILTKHAVRRMHEMDLTEKEIREVIVDADQSFTQRSARGAQVLYQYGDLSVVTARKGDKHIVITVLWRSQKEWTKEEFVRHRLHKQHRHNNHHK